ncbi:MAG: FAD-dependent oxidoreductase, partial [Deltaproteobacteria bacterium]|nr:FAD-dependent oxidoreductase [Deltaproteobacteria bacterium]
MKTIEWPYPIRYGERTTIDADVLVLGGGIAGCWAAISARRAGARVVVVEKGSTIRSGAGGSGGDHWHFAAESPFCPLTAEELAQALVDNHLGYNNGIARYIQCRDSYQTLLELEGMGAKVRDTEDEFAGAPFRDEATKLLYCYDYENKYTLRVWGTTFKPALYRECKRLGVELFDRTMATSLLTLEGPDGRRVVGATGFDVRTGELRVFRAPATVLCLSYPGRLWTCSGDLPGTASFAPIGNSGDGHAMAWEAGAELVMLERTTSNLNGTDAGNSVPPYMMGTWANTWFPCSLVDAEGREVPWEDRDGRLLTTVEERTRPTPGQKFFLMGGGVVAPPHPGVYEYLGPHPIPIPKLLEQGRITLPLYADLPGMPEDERRVIFGMMVGQEAKTDVA